MTVYVDYPFDTSVTSQWPYKKACHMMSDADTDDELHALAERIGLMREWYQGDHYDLTVNKRTLAIEYGAVKCDTIAMVMIRRLKREKQR